MGNCERGPGESRQAKYRAGGVPASSRGVAWIEPNSHTTSSNHDGYQYRFRDGYKDGNWYRYAIPIRNGYVKAYSQSDTDGGMLAMYAAGR